jgi:hypothetical protein
LCATTFVCLGADTAEQLFKAGQKAEKSGDIFHAFLLYSQAARMEPGNVEFAMRKAALQADAGRKATTTIEETPSTEGAEDLAAIPLTDSEMTDARMTRLPPRLKGPKGLKSFDFSGDPKSVIEKVMTSYGMTVVFEGDYQPPPHFRFHLENVGFDDALRTLEIVSNSFLVPVNDSVALMIRDTPQKRTEMSPTMAIAVPIPERMSATEAQEMMASVLQATEVHKFSLDPVKRVIYMRDQVARVVAARSMFNDLSRWRAQVEVDVDFLEVTKSSALGYGLQLPSASSIVNLGSFLGNGGVGAAASSGFSNFLTFGGGASLFGIGVVSSSILATFTKSDSDTILKSQVVTLDGMAATLHVGESYPIVTATYSGGSSTQVASGTSSGLTAPPSINFVDLGLVLKITPSVHDGGEVTLDVSTEFKVLGSTDANGNPTISNRKYTGKVRLRMDESAIVGGLMGVVDGKDINGIAGLSSIPLIGRFLRTNNINKSTDQILLVLRPRLLNVPPWEFGSKTVWMGTESKPLTYF